MRDGVSPSDDDLGRNRNDAVRAQLIVAGENREIANADFTWAHAIYDEHITGPEDWQHAAAEDAQA